MNGAVLRAAHEFWFGRLAGPTDYPRDKAELWFRQSEATDRAVRERFAGDLDPLARSHFDLARMSREEQIGLIILFDQFPRNMFRDSPQAFAYDGLARAAAAKLIAGGRPYYLVERLFLYLPFEHSEDETDQRRAVHLYEELLRDAPEDQKAIYRQVLDYAVKHHDLIARFGRFPHRNAVLGRESTPEEAAFLKEFGRGY